MEFKLYQCGMILVFALLSLSSVYNCALEYDDID